MTWNHRVIVMCNDQNEVWYQIHECYYNKKKDKIPVGWTKNPISIVGETMKDLKWTLKVMKRATKKPVLIEGKDGILEEFEP